MGADIKVESNIAIISGVKRYTGARVNAPDLRAGAALVIAGLAADGITVLMISIISREAMRHSRRSLQRLVQRLPG